MTFNELRKYVEQLEKTLAVLTKENQELREKAIQSQGKKQGYPGR